MYSNVWNKILYGLTGSGKPIMAVTKPELLIIRLEDSVLSACKFHMLIIHFVGPSTAWLLVSTTPPVARKKVVFKPEIIILSTCGWEVTKLKIFYYNIKVQYVHTYYTALVQSVTQHHGGTDNEYSLNGSRYHLKIHLFSCSFNVASI